VGVTVFVSALSVYQFKLPEEQVPERSLLSPSQIVDEDTESPVGNTGVCFTVTVTETPVLLQLPIAQVP
jgi:hypothetical protein